MLKDAWKVRWTKGLPLGRGGHGLAYHATSVAPDQSDQKYVLKELIKQKDPERRARMHREAASLETLEHVGVGKFVESNAADYKDDVELYTITEFIPGHNLEQAVKKERPGLQAAVAMLRQLLDAIEYCHLRGVIHRDLKPDNIILRKNDVRDPVIIDFGQSLNVDDDASSFSSDPEQHLGNRFVILPEFSVVGEDKRDRISDITQLVGILFFSLTGVIPGHMIDSQNRKPHERPPGKGELERLEKSVLKQANRIFEIGFSNEKLRRWQSVPALRAEAEKLLSPEHNDKRPLADRIAALKQRLADTPQYALADRIEELTKLVIAAFEHAWNRIYGDLNDRLRDAAYGTYQTGSSANQHFRSISFNLKYDPTAKLSLAVHGSVEEGEYVVWGNDSVGDIELCRFGIFDPLANEIITRAIEGFMCDQLEERLS